MDEINWDNKWSLMETVTYYQATMLSLDTPPEMAHFVPLSANEVLIQFNPNHQFKKITEEQAIDRYWVIKNNAPTNKFFFTHEELLFQIFSIWANITKLTIPEKLKEIGKKAELKFNKERENHPLKRWILSLKESNQTSSDYRSTFADIESTTPKTIEVLQNSKLRENQIRVIERDKRLLEIIKELGYDPLNLPKVTHNKPWVRAKAKEVALKETKLFTKSTFDKSWDKHRKEGEIKELEH
jgi:hypothetical protein